GEPPDGLGHLEGQRERRRDRARSSDRRLGLQDPGHAAARDAEARREEGARLAVHRRRHGRSTCSGALEAALKDSSRTLERNGKKWEIKQRSSGSPSPGKKASSRSFRGSPSSPAAWAESARRSAGASRAPDTR